jgi:hypothetical protein
MTALARVIVKIQELLVLTMLITIPAQLKPMPLLPLLLVTKDGLCNLVVSDNFLEPTPYAMASKTSSFRNTSNN